MGRERPKVRVPIPPVRLILSLRGFYFLKVRFTELYVWVSPQVVKDPDKVCVDGGSDVGVLRSSTPVDNKSPCPCACRVTTYGVSCGKTDRRKRFTLPLLWEPVPLNLRFAGGTVKFKDKDRRSVRGYRARGGFGAVVVQLESRRSLARP